MVRTTAQQQNRDGTRRLKTNYDSLFYSPSIVQQTVAHGHLRVDRRNEVTQFHQHMLQTAKKTELIREHRFTV